MNPSNQVTISEAEQAFNIEVEDAIETRLEKSKALSEHASTWYSVNLHWIQCHWAKGKGWVVSKSNVNSS